MDTTSDDRREETFKMFNTRDSIEGRGRISRQLARIPCLAAAMAFPLATPAAAQDSDLAQQLSNPVASLISVPFQFNYDQNLGAAGTGSRLLMNFQPVVPITIGPELNLISRTIVPVLGNDGIVPGTSPSGVGNIVQSFFFSPKAPTSGGLIWGAGPVFQLPTSTDPQFGPDQFAAGVTGVVLTQRGGWTVGTLANQLWDVGGSTDISSLFFQPFVTYTTPNAWTFGFNTETSYNWLTEQASVPINFTVTKLIKINGQPVSVGGGVRYWADSPPGGAEGWGARFVITFLYPKK